METYVMGDIHGNYEGLCECLELSKFNYATDTLVQLGDVADGGDRVCDCIDTLLKIPHLIAIKGNHDAWLDEFIKTGYHPAMWQYGGLGTVASYLNAVKKPTLFKAAGKGFKVSLNPHDIPKAHQQFFDKQMLYYIDKNRNCFVHGGFERWLPFEGQRPENYYWNRQLWEEALEWQVKHRFEGFQEPFDMASDFATIFIGHNSTLNYGLNLPLKAANIYNLDTGSGKNGRLTIMNVESKQFWQSDRA